MNAYKDFGPFDGKVWLNVASEGPLPHPAVAALKDTLEWKLQPFQLTIPKFTSVPYQLKVAIGTLINVDPQDVILGNSATYGLQILANGLPLKEGDQVLLMQNDFPANIVPWLALTKKGINVRQVKAREHVLTPEEVLENISPNTKVLCLSWVHTFSGHKIDAVKIGEICRERKIIFILNCSQAIGAFSVDISRIPADAIVCAGYKWMLGPYGTGFCWIKPEVRETLTYNHAYWQSMLNESQLMSTEEIVLSEHKSARNYDVFGTANFFNFVPWTASIQYLMKLGMDQVQQYNQQLVGMILEGIDPKQFKLISPSDPVLRSNLVVFSHQDPQRNESIFNRLKDAGVFLALWKGNLRVSAHIHNSRFDIEKFVKVLNRQADPNDRNERPERPERPERSGRNDRHGRHDRHGRNDRNGGRNERNDRNEPKPNEPKPSEQGDQNPPQAPTERNEHNDQNAPNDRIEHNDHNDQNAPDEHNEQHNENKEHDEQNEPNERNDQPSQ